MLSDLNLSAITNSIGYLFISGMRVTVSLTMLATAGGIVFGTVLALMRMSPISIVSKFAESYVNLIRALPLVLVIFWLYFLMPYLVGWIIGASRPISIGGFISAAITFTLSEAAYFSEIIRAGIQSVPRGQIAASHALGLTRGQAMAFVILPQAFRNMLPVLLTQTIILFQDTSLVYVVSLTDFLGAASNIAQRDGTVVEIYLFVALTYFTISFCASLMVKGLQRRIAIIR